MRTLTPRVVTVIGGSGFLGRYIVRRLAADGWAVRVAVRHPNNAIFLKTAGFPGQVVPVQVNIRDEASLRRAIAGSHGVINLVGVLASSGKQTFEALQKDGAQTIARLAAEEGVEQLVHMSALGADKDSQSRYAQTKAAGEEAVRKAFPKAIIFRPSLVFGPEDKFFNLFAKIACLSPVLPLFGGGETRFSPVYVEDVAAAVVTSLSHADFQGKTYTLTGPETMSLREIMALVCESVGRKRILLPIPAGATRLMGLILGNLPGKMLTLDQAFLLETDNIRPDNALGLEAFHITPQAPSALVPAYLHRFRNMGRYDENFSYEPLNGREG